MSQPRKRTRSNREAAQAVASVALKERPGDSRMSASDRLNYLNIGLMLLSCAVAYVVPFHLFLFSYAVLGPLHYLTEISWLHDRRYFTRSPQTASGGHENWWLALVGVTVAVMLCGAVAEKVLHQPMPPVWEIGLFYLVFITAALFVFRQNKFAAATVIAVTGLGLLMFNSSPYYGLVAFLLITIVHVLVFTGAFILFGALKARSVSGVLSLVVFVLCAGSFFVVIPETFGPGADAFVRKTYASFETLNAQLIRFFHLGPGTSMREIYESSAGLVVMRLIAFAYTYHYLNWFSKTSVIKWHDISKRRAGVILGLWAGALVLYATSYELGFIVLYFLSVLHVMLEFPLNHQSFVGIGRELFTFGPRRAPAS